MISFRINLLSQQWRSQGAGLFLHLIPLIDVSPNVLCFKRRTESKFPLLLLHCILLFKLFSVQVCYGARTHPERLHLILHCPGPPPWAKECAVSWPPRYFSTLQNEVLHSPGELELLTTSGWSQSDDEVAGPLPSNTTRSGLALVFHALLSAQGLVTHWCMPRSQIPACSQVYALLKAKEQRDANCQVILQVPGARTVSALWI